MSVEEYYKSMGVVHTPYDCLICKMEQREARRGFLDHIRTWIVIDIVLFIVCAQIGLECVKYIIWSITP